MLEFMDFSYFKIVFSMKLNYETKISTARIAYLAFCVEILVYMCLAIEK